MTKITYASLKLKTNNEVETFDFNGNKIEVLKYLPIEDKYSLVNITLQEAREGNIYNPIKIDMHFHLNLVYMYTNITFTEKQREDESKLYDTLMSNGFINLMLEKISEDEYNNLLEYMGTLMSDILEYNNSVSGTIRELIDNLPAQAAQMNEIIDSFDKEKFQNVIDFAKAANGGREL